MDLGFEGGFSVPTKCINKNIHPDWIESENGDWVKLYKNDFITILANDIKTSCYLTYKRYFDNHSDHIADYSVQSIIDLVKEAEMGKGPLATIKADIITGGFPCQDFSLNGKRMGFNSDKNHMGVRNTFLPTVETRGMLYYWMMKAIEHVKPKCFIAENVKGLALMEDVVNTIQSDFRSIGYLVLPARILYAPEYGIAQTRERIIFIGFHKAQLKPNAINKLSKPFIDPSIDPYPKKTHRFKIVREEHKSIIQDMSLQDPTTTEDVLISLPEPHLSTDPSQNRYSLAKYLGRNIQGQIEIDLKGPGPTIRSEHHGNIEYRRLSIANGGKHLTELNEGKIERRLSVRECARIQSFPDDYQFILPPNGTYKGVPMSEAYKLIGNAVPPLLGYHIARRLQELWNQLF